MTKLLPAVAVFLLSYYLLFSLYNHTKLPVTMTILTSLFLLLWLFHFRRESIIVMLRKQIILIIFDGCIVWFVVCRTNEHIVIKALLLVTFTLFFLACHETARRIVKWLNQGRKQ